MPRLVATCLFLCSIIVVYGQPLSEVRQKFHAAVLDPSNVTKYHSYISKIKSEEPIIKAYKAVGEAVLAQEKWDPISKFSQLKKFSNLIEQAVYLDDRSLEIRFLRFAVEFQLPRILMMSDHLDEDRDFIMANLHEINQLNIDPGFVRYITYFMNETGLLDADQLIQIKASLTPSFSN